LTISIWNECQLLDTVEQLSFFCHLLESGLARINWIRAVDKICVEQLFSCKKCRAIACRAIAIRAVHPHSFKSIGLIDWLIDRLLIPLYIYDNYKNMKWHIHYIYMVMLHLNQSTANKIWNIKFATENPDFYLQLKTYVTIMLLRWKSKIRNQFNNFKNCYISIN
jgi:hypothetical protein